MNAAVVYDSMFGNTEQLAKQIAQELGPATLIKVKALHALHLSTYDLVVIGSPTQAGGPSVTMRVALRRTGEHDVRTLPMAVFDTRFHQDLNKTGSAALRMAKRLQQKGARLVVAPESFFVGDMKGPLEDGELARAALWAQSIRAAIEAPAALPAR